MADDQDLQRGSAGQAARPVLARDARQGERAPLHRRHARRRARPSTRNAAASSAQIEAALKSAGAGWANVVQFTTYLVHSQDIPKFMQWRLREFPQMFPDGATRRTRCSIIDRLVRRAVPDRGADRRRALGGRFQIRQAGVLDVERAAALGARMVHATRRQAQPASLRVRACVVGELAVEHVELRALLIGRASPVVRREPSARGVSCPRSPAAGRGFSD